MVMILRGILKHTGMSVAEFTVNHNTYLLANEILIQLTVSWFERFVLFIWLSDSMFLPNKQKGLCPGLV